MTNSHVLGILEEKNGQHADDEQDGAADEHLRQRHLAGGQCSRRRFRPPGSGFSESEGGDNGRDSHHHHHHPGETHSVHNRIQGGDELLDYRRRTDR